MMKQGHKCYGSLHIIKLHLDFTTAGNNIYPKRPEPFESRYPLITDFFSKCLKLSIVYGSEEDFVNRGNKRN